MYGINCFGGGGALHCQLLMQASLISKAHFYHIIHFHRTSSLICVHTPCTYTQSIYHLRWQTEQITLTHLLIHHNSSAMFSISTSVINVVAFYHIYIFDTDTNWAWTCFLTHSIQLRVLFLLSLEINFFVFCFVLHGS